MTIKKTDDLPVTLKQLAALEKKLMSQSTSIYLKTTSNQEDIRYLNKRIDSLKSEISSKFAKVDMRFDKLEGRMDKLEARMDRLEDRMDRLEDRMDRFEQAVMGRFAEMDIKFEKMMTAIHHLTLIVEEQNSRNKFVLDGYNQVFEQQKQILERLDKLEKATFGATQI